MSDDQAVFSFELNESLYFERGQEVSEMVGISLEPEISIQPFNDYISIRGVMELQGEYVKKNGSKDDDLESDEFQGKRYMERVTNNEHGGMEFSHQFPVEISVPADRVHDVDHVSVSIDAFDYELPSQNRLTFTSTINIHGISEQRSDAGQIAEEDTSLQDASEDAEEEETFSFDLKHIEKAEDPEESVRDTDKSLTDHGEAGQDTIEKPDASDGIAASEKDRWKEKVQSLAEFFGNDKETETTEAKNTELADIDNDELASNELTIGNDVQTTEAFDETESLEDRLELEDQAKSENFLSSMMRDREEHYAKMRVCIVQEFDTLESIADRYKITPVQLLNQNRLDDETIQAGQLLYIPLK